MGGLSGSKRSSGKINSVSLRITINDTKRPLHDIILMDGKTRKAGVSAMEQARHWHGLIAVIIRAADIDDAQQNVIKKAAEAESTSRVSLADELLKMSDLRDKGILTDEEFSLQKQKLLS